MDTIRAALHAADAPRRAVDFALGAALFALPPSARARLFAGRRHRCPVCEAGLDRFLVLHRDYFRWCPACRSLQRHRFVWLLFRDRVAGLEARGKVLHVAPEPGLAARLAAIPGVDYLSGDLHNPRAMVKMDVCDIRLPDGSLDLIYCSHVLEHVPDDRRAMREFQRVLAPGGAALILVPVFPGPTVEDPGLADPVQRERRFGQWDHVRTYGADVQDRLIEAGLSVTRVRAADVYGPADIERFGLEPEEIAFICRKPD